MVTVTYVEADGTEHVVDVDENMNLMEGATLNMVPGVEGMCGGICSCATCHCYIEGEWADKVAEAQPGELGMLETALHRKPGSRLGCQINVTQALEGIVVHLPPEQGSGD